MTLPFVFRGIVLPEHLRESIDRYVQQGIPTGGFLESVIENNLRESIGRADQENLQVIPAIVGYLYLKCPAGCWGFPAAFDKWLELKRKQREMQQAQLQKQHDAHLGTAIQD